MYTSGIFYAHRNFLILSDAPKPFFLNSIFYVLVLPHTYLNIFARNPYMLIYTCTCVSCICTHIVTNRLLDEWHREKEIRLEYIPGTNRRRKNIPENVDFEWFWWHSLLEGYQKAQLEKYLCCCIACCCVQWIIVSLPCVSYLPCDLEPIWTHMYIYMYTHPCIHTSLYIYIHMVSWWFSMSYLYVYIYMYVPSLKHTQETKLVYIYRRKITSNMPPHVVQCSAM